MKLKSGFIMRKIAGKDIVLPSGDELNLNTMITLNESGMFIWKKLDQETTEDEIVDALIQEYKIDRNEAKEHVASFIKTLDAYGFLQY